MLRPCSATCRVRERLPDDPAALRPMTDATDAVILHLWQATQIVIDLATAVLRREVSVRGPLPYFQL